MAGAISALLVAMLAACGGNDDGDDVNPTGAASPEGTSTGIDRSETSRGVTFEFNGTSVEAALEAVSGELDGVELPDSSSVPAGWEPRSGAVMTSEPVRIDISFFDEAAGRTFGVSILPDPGDYSPGNAEVYEDSDAGTVYLEESGGAANLALEQPSGRVVVLGIGPGDSELDIDEYVAILKQLAE